MRRALLLSLASTAVILGACSDQRAPDPVGPEDVEADASLVDPCPSSAQEPLLDGIREDIDELFIGRGGKRPATAHIDNIERKLCEEQYDDALDMAWGFLGLLSEKFPDEFDGDAQDAAQLASDVFALVGADPNPAGTAFEIPPEVFEAGGTIVTFDPSTASQENPIVITIDDNVGGEDIAALVVDDPAVFPPGSGLVTVAMSRASDDDVTDDEQTFIPGFDAFPVGVTIISSHQPSDQGPGILIALCALGGDVIGHNHQGGVELLVPTDPDPQALGYIDCGDIDEYFGDIDEEAFFGYGPDGAPGWARLAHRLVEPLGRFLAPPALNADAVAMGVEGPGLGGRTRSLSDDAPVDAQIEIEESVQLSVGTEAAWSSDDTNVATVDQDGLVTGVGDGTANIEATFTDVTGAITTLSMAITVGSGLEVTCFPELPDPVLVFDSVQPNQPIDDGAVDRYWMSITNYEDYPAELFTITGAYGACGLNDTPSRTWLDIYRADDDTRVYGYCGFDDPADLTAFQVAFPSSTDPPDVFVTLTDRACETTYTSNELDLYILE